MPITQDWNPKQWSNNELIFAKDLNRIEDAITLINNHATSDIGDGMITFKNQNIYNETPVIAAYGHQDTGYGAIIYQHMTGGDDVTPEERHRWYFRQYCTQPIASNNNQPYREDYMLPKTTLDRVGNGSYEILTSKKSRLVVITADSVPIPKNTITTLCSTGTLEDGLYFINANVDFSANASGIRGIAFSRNNDTSTWNIDRWSEVRVGAAPTGVTRIGLTMIRPIPYSVTINNVATSFNEVFLKANQTSDADLTIHYAGIQIVRIY